LIEANEEGDGCDVAAREALSAPAADAGRVGVTSELVGQFLIGKYDNRRELLTCERTPA
jgi:hypothetical protein